MDQGQAEDGGAEQRKEHARPDPRDINGNAAGQLELALAPLAARHPQEELVAEIDGQRAAQVDEDAFGPAQNHDQRLIVHGVHPRQRRCPCEGLRYSG